MEMRTPFAFDRACGKEHVHQHGLAAADVSKQVEPADRLFAPLTPPNSQRRRRFARQPMLAQRLKPRQQLSASCPRGIALVLPRRSTLRTGL
jgi:hypothetical protein